MALKRGIQTTEFWLSAGSIALGGLAAVLAPVWAPGAAAIGAASGIAYVICRTVAKIQDLKAGITTSDVSTETVTQTVVSDKTLVQPVSVPPRK